MPTKQEWEADLRRWQNLWRDPSFSFSSSINTNISALCVRSKMRTDEINFQKMVIRCVLDRNMDEFDIALVTNILQ